MMNRELDCAAGAGLCDNVMNRYLALDKGERLPLAVTLHLLRCKECRTQVRLMSVAERVASRRRRRRLVAQKPVTLTKWVIGGICMIVCMLAFVFIADFYASETLWMAFALVFAASVTGYSAFFVGCNLDFFVKKIRRL